MPCHSRCDSNLKRALLQELTLSLEVAKHYATALNLLRGPGRAPIDPESLVGYDVEAVSRLSEVRPCGSAHLRASDLADRTPPIAHLRLCGQHTTRRSSTVSSFRLVTPRALPTVSAGVHSLGARAAGARGGSRVRGRKVARGSGSQASHGACLLRSQSSGESRRSRELRFRASSGLRLNKARTGVKHVMISTLMAYAYNWL